MWPSWLSHPFLNLNQLLPASLTWVHNIESVPGGISVMCEHIPVLELRII